MTAVHLNAMGVACALGQGAEAVRAGLFASRIGGVAETDLYTPGRPLHLGAVPGELPSVAHLPRRLRSRNNALMLASLAQIRTAAEAAVNRFGPRRVAVILGVSTGGIDEGEWAAHTRLAESRWPDDFDYAQQELGNAAACLAFELGTQGPAHVISTACSSGAKALASGGRLLRAGLVDAVVAGGVDVLCRFTIEGFQSLDSVSAARCNPLSLNRCGINLGEGSALFLMTCDEGPMQLAGWGETSDAHHMSAPDPRGGGAIDAMHQAIKRGGLRPGAIDYLNLHGTATPHNDAMECLAVAEAVGLDVPVSSTKPLTGHTLAAAGAIEAAIAWLTLVDNPQGRLPPHWWDGVRDPTLAAVRPVSEGETLGRAPRHVLSNSFAFGGSNASLLFSAS